MDTKTLYTFKKIIETGSFQNAAYELNYAPSTVSFQIRQLENELSLKLFRKRGSKIELTKDGNALLPLIDDILQNSEKLLSFQKGEQKAPESLIIGAHESLTTHYLQTLLKDFKTLAPDVNILIQSMGPSATYEQLVKGTIDIGICYDIHKYVDDLVIEPLSSYPLVLLSSPEFTEVERDFITPNQTKAFSMIYYEADTYQEKIMTEYLHKKNILLEPSLRINSTEALKQTVATGLGIALMPRFTAEKEIKQGILTEIQTEIPSTCQLTAIYLYNKRNTLTPAQKLFLQLLEQAAKSEKI